MSTNHYDYITRIRQAIAALIVRDESYRHATQVKNAMDGACTGTELLLSVRHSLAEIPLHVMTPEALGIVRELILTIPTLLPDIKFKPTLFDVVE